MLFIYEVFKIMILKCFMKLVNFFFWVINLCFVINFIYLSIMLINRKGVYSEIFNNIILVFICKVENNRDLV